MVFVDFSNPYLRGYLATGYLANHEKSLNRVRDTVHQRVERFVGRPDFAGRAKPLAAVLDIDEIVLANIHMNVFSEGGQSPFYACDYYHTPDGKPWPRDDTRLNPLLPGAKKLIAELIGHGVEVFFITGRAESLRAETVENFVYVGLAGPANSTKGLFDEKELSDVTKGKLVMCPDAELPLSGKSIRPFKESQRAIIDQTHQIIMNIGDQVSDLGFYGYEQILISHPFYRTP